MTFTEDFVGKVLARQLRGVRIDPAGIARLLKDLEAVTFKAQSRRLGLKIGAAVASIFGIDTLAQFKLTATKFSQFERKVLTLFILGSNLLDVRDPKSDVVTYSPPTGICTNRFAQFDRE